LSRDQQIIASDRLPLFFEFGPEDAVYAVGWLLERQYLDGSGHSLDLSREPCRSVFHGTVTQFGGNYDAGRY
jgi:hypothetical protein